ncbi:MAG: hypothetical protein HRU18_01460 [Pseudoalteromonas sp.]|uniref:hypothetical protein n=1 Tax=Pseudoalteromonas sp. TaxID=53249 RepID=UPI001D2ADE00|nr:hypothetical protein [Pseudoalteromonas sp.]NRA76848.1 hypothetical protein [Pseudoalteromonas sp.]
MKEPDADYIKALMWIVGIINTVLSPVLLTWLKKTYNELKESKESNEKLRKQLKEDSRKLELDNTTFEHNLTKTLNDEILKITKEVDRKISASNYELERNRKGIDDICANLLHSSDKFDKKVADASSRLQSEMITKSVYYQETGKFKEEFLRDLLLFKSGLKSYSAPSNTNIDNLSNQVKEIYRKLNTLINKFDNEKIDNHKKHNLSRRLLGIAVNDRKQININVNNFEAKLKQFKLETDFKLDNYNKLLTGLKNKNLKKE